MEVCTRIQYVTVRKSVKTKLFQKMLFMIINVHNDQKIH